MADVKDDHLTNLMEWVADVEPPIATIRFRKVDKELEDYYEHHVSLALALESVRFDDRIRVVVIAGRDDDSGVFELGVPKGQPVPEKWDLTAVNPITRPQGPGAMRGPWNLTQGIERTFQTLAFMEKPVIGKLGGSAGGFAAHAMWGCDILVAREDASVTESHISPLNRRLPSMSAGDGVFAFLPLYMTPTKFKEFVLLGGTLTGRELFELGIANAAVPAEELDAKVDYYVQKFLERPPAPLIRTKRACNKRLIEQMNLTFDYAWAAESNDLWEFTATGFDQQMTLRPDEPNWKVPTGPFEVKGVNEE